VSAASSAARASPTTFVQSSAAAAAQLLVVELLVHRAERNSERFDDVGLAEVNGVSPKARFNATSALARSPRAKNDAALRRRGNTRCAKPVDRVGPAVGLRTAARLAGQHNDAT
jgi:hypothetical protein